jgi:hypothetical protein
MPLALLSAQQPGQEAAKQEAPKQEPVKVGFVLKDRHGHAVPTRNCTTTRSGGGNVEVAQPREDTLVFTMTGVVTAGPHPCKEASALMDFDLNQQLVIAFADPTVKKAKLMVEGHLVGLLRGDAHGGGASVGPGEVVLKGCNGPAVLLAVEGHSVGGDDNLAVNDHKGPVSVPVVPGEYHLLQAFHISAAHARSICGKAASSEFAPDPALDPTWISVTEPFRGARKKDFGFRVILRVEPD